MIFVILRNTVHQKSTLSVYQEGKIPFDENHKNFCGLFY